MIEKLKADYDFIVEYKGDKDICIKYSFDYKTVNVNLYFDMFDSKIKTLNLVLRYEKNYYFTTLNVSNIEIPTQYLKEIPIEILNRIMDANNSLTAFFLTLNEHVEINKPSIAKYSKDYTFLNALEHNKSEENKPFLHFLRRTKMSNEAFSLLRSTMDIPVAILNLIQSNGMTLVRTDKIEFRKEITAIMNEHGFKI